MLSFYKRGGVNPPHAEPFPGRRAGKLWGEAMDGRLIPDGFEGKYSGLSGHFHEDCAAFFRPDCRNRQRFPAKVLPLSGERLIPCHGLSGTLWYMYLIGDPVYPHEVYARAGVIDADLCRAFDVICLGSCLNEFVQSAAPPLI